MQYCIHQISKLERPGMTQNKFKLWIMTLLLLNSLACSGGKQKGGSDGTAEGDSNVAAETKDGEKSNAEANAEFLGANVGILNFRQLASTYSDRTGVQLDGEVLDEYSKQFSALNKTNDVTLLTPSTVSAVTKLASAFCNAMIADADLVSQKLPDVAIDGASVSDTASLASDLLGEFYGPENVLQADRSKDEADLKSYLDDLNGQGLAASSVVFGGCTAVLASAEFYLY